MRTRIESTLDSLKIPCTIADTQDAPQVTRYRLVPGDYPYVGRARPRKIRVSEIRSRIADIEIALGVYGISISQASELWLEIPKPTPDHVEIDDFLAPARKLAVPIIVGRGMDGSNILLDLSKPSTPHVLVAGATGSGKSTAINTMIAGIVQTTDPSEVGLCMADPKYIELGVWKVKHLVYPVAQDLDDIEAMLIQVAYEMEDRYQGFGQVECKHIVVVIDEFADLVTRNSNVEDIIIRLAQKGRAAGIHIVLATQRPSVDIVTGAIKANFPVRIAFAMPTQMDSRVILDRPGAERLCGMGDGLIRSGFRISRFQGPITRNIPALAAAYAGIPLHSYGEIPDIDDDFSPAPHYDSHVNMDGAVVAAGIGIGMVGGCLTIGVGIIQGLAAFIGGIFDTY